MSVTSIETALPTAKPAPAPSPWNPVTEARLKDLWSKGLSLRAIGAELGGITRNQVVGKVHRLGLEGRPSPLTPGSQSWYRSEGKAISFDAKLYAERQAEAAAKAESEARAEELRLAMEAEARTAEAERLAAVERAQAVASRTVEALFGPSDDKGAPLAVGGLRKGQCKWPFGDPRDGDFCFCSGRAREGDVYCVQHASLAYVPSQPRRVRAA